MTEIVRFESEALVKPTFEAREYSLPGVTVENLGTGMGRLAIFKALVEHQASEDLVAQNQVWAGVNGISLVKMRTLFSNLNPTADPTRLNRNFNATQLAHWRDVVGETKYSPFTYIYKAYLPDKYSSRQRSLFPTIVGFDLSKIKSANPRDNENIDWSPIEGETTESALTSVYYFSGLFPRIDHTEQS